MMYFLLYLIENITKINTLLVILSFFGAIGLFAYMILKFIAVEDFNTVIKDKALKYYILLLFVTVASPTEKTMATITINYLINQEEQVKNTELYDTLYNIVMSKIINEPKD